MANNDFIIGFDRLYVYRLRNNYNALVVMMAQANDGFQQLGPLLCVCMCLCVLMGWSISGSYLIMSSVLL